MPTDQRKRKALSRLADVTDQILSGRSIAQYAAICVRLNDKSKEPEILLITSRDTGRWVIPKGWGMRNKEPHEVAEREAWEEAGIIGPAEKVPCGSYTYVKSLGKRELAPAIVQVHLLTVERCDRKFPEKGQRLLQWFTPYEASVAVAEPELKSLLARVPRLLREPGNENGETEIVAIDGMCSQHSHNKHTGQNLWMGSSAFQRACGTGRIKARVVNSSARSLASPPSIPLGAGLASPPSLRSGGPLLAGPCAPFQVGPPLGWGRFR